MPLPPRQTPPPKAWSQSREQAIPFSCVDSSLPAASKLCFLPLTPMQPWHAHSLNYPTLLYDLFFSRLARRDHKNYSVVRCDHITSNSVPLRMPVTHDDLSLRKAQERRTARAGSRLAVSLVVLSVLGGLISFILCLAAEGSRSEASYYLLTVRGDGSQALECIYNSSGQTPLACAVAAFVLLAAAMFAEHAYMLLAVALPESSSIGSTVGHEHPRMSSSSATLTWQACCLFLFTWICFGLAEVLLMIGIGVESGHLSNWNRPRPVCHRVRPGMFAAAGILGLTTVIIGFVAYITAVQTQRLRQEVGGYVVHQGGPSPGHGHHQPQPPLRPPPPAPTAPAEPPMTAAACQARTAEANYLTKTSTCV